MSRLGNIEDSTTKLHEQNQSSKLADPNGFQRSFFCHPNSKPSKTEISKVALFFKIKKCFFLVSFEISLEISIEYDLIG